MRRKKLFIATGCVGVGSRQRHVDRAELAQTKDLLQPRYANVWEAVHLLECQDKTRHSRCLDSNGVDLKHRDEGLVSINDGMRFFVSDRRRDIFNLREVVREHMT
ncbi:hypothetical protein AWB75_06108 [Caballeronia catudaia]|uniref:Uncharacterized protein n=1 Tax=Caballeronia catudaia TaxID=1777136 RepID=A0A158D382_9BURK|nr:hypothetical protein AWB75_06108 [Caballeronia catudaia]